MDSMNSMDAGLRPGYYPIMLKQEFNNENVYIGCERAGALKSTMNHWRGSEFLVE